MKQIVETGQAPHFTEIAAQLDVPVEEGRRLSRNWSGFKADTEDGMNPLSDILKLFSGNFFSRRLDPDYHFHMRGYMW